MRRTLIGICTLMVTVVPAVPAEVAIIVNKSVPISTIDSRTLYDLYAGDIRQWSNGQPVVLLDLGARTEVKDTFYGYMGKSSSRMKSIWMKNMLSGEGKPPESLASETELVQRVAATPGAIGYVSRPAASGTTDVITIIVIDGKTGD